MRWIELFLFWAIFTVVSCHPLKPEEKDRRPPASAVHWDYSRTLFLKIQVSKRQDSSYHFTLVKKQILPVKSKGIFSDRLQTENVPSGKWILSFFHRQITVLQITTDNPLIQRYEAPGDNQTMTAVTVRKDTAFLYLKIPYGDTINSVKFVEKTGRELRPLGVLSLP